MEGVCKGHGVMRDERDGIISWQLAARSQRSEVRGQKTEDSYSSIVFFASGSWLLSPVSLNLDGLNDLRSGLLTSESVRMDDGENH